MNFYESLRILPLTEEEHVCKREIQAFYKQAATSFHSELPNLAQTQSYHSCYSTNCQQSCKITKIRVSPIRFLEKAQGQIISKP